MTSLENSRNSSRLHWVDALRGFAILAMIPANLLHYYAEPHPLWFRVFASCTAAPIFIAVSAGMVILGSGNRTLAYYVWRGGYVVLIGALLDLGLWRIVPFVSMDVLYLIGLGIPVAYGCRRLPVGWLFVASVVVFAVSAALRRYFGYHPEPLYALLISPHLPEFPRLLASWFIDGWFPVFPWLGFVFLGLVVFRMFLQGAGWRLRAGLSIAGILFATTGLVWLFAPLPGVHNVADGLILPARIGYSEIFYPPTPAYLTTATGTVFLVTSVFMNAKIPNYLGLLPFFGRYALLIYILHQALGVVLIAPSLSVLGISKIESGAAFLFALLAVILAATFACKLVDCIKVRYPPRSLFTQLLFGR